MRSKTKLHVSVGHATVMAELSFFGLPDGEEGGAPQPPQGDAVAAALERLGKLTLQVLNDMPCGAGRRYPVVLKRMPCRVAAVRCTKSRGGTALLLLIPLVNHQTARLLCAQSRCLCQMAGRVAHSITQLCFLQQTAQQAAVVLDGQLVDPYLPVYKRCMYPTASLVILLSSRRW